MNPSTPTLWFDELDSTNAEARRRAEAGDTSDLWIAARRQTQGRGRRGRVWESPTGNLYATLLTTTDKPPAEAAQISFVAALAVGEVIDGCLIDAGAAAARSRLKWPNDVLIDGAKVSGILVESGAASPNPPHPQGGGGGPSPKAMVEGALAASSSPPVMRPPAPPQSSAAPPTGPPHAGEQGRGTNTPPPRLWLAIGIGINLAEAPVAPERPATRLADHLRGLPPPAAEAALDSLAAAFAGWRAPWERHGFELIRQSWLEKAYGMGQPCEARLGTETLEGLAEGLDISGALRLRTPEGIRLISAGDVFPVTRSASA